MGNFGAAEGVVSQLHNTDIEPVGEEMKGMTVIADLEGLVQKMDELTPSAHKLEGAAVSREKEGALRTFTGVESGGQVTTVQSETTTSALKDVGDKTTDPVSNWANKGNRDAEWAKSAAEVRISLKGRAFNLANKCLCTQADIFGTSFVDAVDSSIATDPSVLCTTDGSFGPINHTYPEDCLPGWCVFEHKRGKRMFFSLDGQWVLKVGEFVESQMAPFIRSLDSSLVNSHLWDYVVYQSELFEVGMLSKNKSDVADSNDTYRSKVAGYPAFLSARRCGTMQNHQTGYLYSDSYWALGTWYCTSRSRTVPVCLDNYIETLLGLESLVGKFSLLFFDLQFLASEMGLVLFDTAIAQVRRSKGHGTPKLTDPLVRCGPITEQGMPPACLHQNKLRNWLLCGILRYLVAKHDGTASPVLDKPMGKGAGYKAWYPTIIDQSALRIQADCATEDFILAKLPANIPSGLQKKLEADPQWGVLATRLEKLYGTQESGVVDPSGFVCFRRLKGPLEASHDPGIEFHVGHNPSQVLDSGWVMPDMKSFMPVDDARQFNEVGSQ
jgi:hypothetical protein